MDGKRPNVLFIAVDDLRDFATCMQSYPDVITPNIDRLAKRGILFANAHCQAPMCAPSRNSLLSGILPSTSGAYGFQPFKVIPAFKNVDTLPKHFKNNGYHVMGTGKIHHNAPTHGPDASEWHEYWPSIENPVNTFNGDAPPKSKENCGGIVWKVGDTPEEECGDYLHASWAAEQLSKEYDKPFFLALGFYKPHLPLVCPKKYFDMYDRDKLQDVYIKEDDLDDIPDAGKMRSNRVIYEYVKSNKMEKDLLHAYLACITYMDAQLGRVLDALDSGPNADNTIIVFWGDNGWHLGEKHHWTKFTLWRESTRVPLIISCPGKAQDRICTKPVGLIDLFPTLNELCSLGKPPQKLEGMSIVPLLDDPETEWETPVITTFGRDSHSLTTERWKYIKYFDGSEELYDRLFDTFEWYNLAENPSYQHIKDELKKYLPKINVPNEPGTTLPHVFASDYPNIEAWREKYYGKNNA
ncbi:MAG: Choline-sulfatase [Firmicutes bacterium ADurb.Bin193]|nr:MAG: Choline-sulfatase [Firmicutes bacterium ADurb.Bin193]